MGDEPFAGRAPRPDQDESFPAELVEMRGPALLAQPDATAAALVAAHLLRRARMFGGTRVSIAAVDAAIEALERAVPPDAQRWCEDEATRIARWSVAPPPQAPALQGDRAVMAAADAQARVDVVRWAIANELDLEIEWYDPEDERWPRQRVTPLRVGDEGGEAVVVVETELAAITIAIADVRWVMPVERRPRSNTAARVLEFPTRPRAEE